MAILTLPPFTPANPWVRPETPEAWQAEIQGMDKDEIEMVKIGATPGLGSFCVGMGLSLGYLGGILFGLFGIPKGTFIPALCFAPLLLVGIWLCFIFASDDRKDARKLQASPVLQRRLAISEVSPDFMRGPISKVPPAYVEFLSLEKTKVPLLLGDVADICQRHGIALFDEGDVANDWASSLMLGVALALLVGMLVGGLSAAL